MVLLKLRVYLMQRTLQMATGLGLKYQGTAKVSLDQIQFDPPLPRNLDPKNLERLEQVFREDCCRRYNVENYVPAVVSQQDLTSALELAGVPQESLMTDSPDQSPLIRFPPGKLRGLHGRHRIQVGSKVLPPMDRWWMVDLYLDGKSSRFLGLCPSNADSF